MWYADHKKNHITNQYKHGGSLILLDIKCDKIKFRFLPKLEKFKENQDLYGTCNVDHSEQKI